MTAAEARRAAFARAGVPEAQLAGLDREIALQREAARAERDTANLLRLQDTAWTQTDRVLARLGEISAFGDLMSNEQRGAAFMQALGNVNLGQAPLLGSLSASSSEVGSILQAALVPQVDKFTEIKTILEAIFAGDKETRALWERVGEWMKELRDTWQN